MKNVKVEYTTTLESRGHSDKEWTFVGHTTKAWARASVHEAYNPCLVELIVETPSGLRTIYDAFPAGHPLPTGCAMLERNYGRGIGWKPVRRGVWEPA